MASDHIIEDWDFWCYYKKVLRNRINNAETLIETGKYLHSNSGILRFGTKSAMQSSTEEIRDYYLVVFKPNIGRLPQQDYPSSAKLSIILSTVVLNVGNSSIVGKIKCWYHPNGRFWTSSDNVGFNNINEYFVPSDILTTDYDSSIYEKSETIGTNNLTVEFDEIEQIFWKFMRGKTTGFTLSATGGYCDIYGSEYNPYTLRPQFTIGQTVSSKMHSNLVIDSEIKALSRIKGTCKDRNGNALTGIQCRITAFDPDEYKIIGTGLSSAADGTFLIDIDYRVGDNIIVSFVNEVQSISGSEIMKTVSYNTV